MAVPQKRPSWTAPLSSRITAFRRKSWGFKNDQVDSGATQRSSTPPGTKPSSWDTFKSLARYATPRRMSPRNSPRNLPRPAAPPPPPGADAAGVSETRRVLARCLLAHSVDEVVEEFFVAGSSARGAAAGRGLDAAGVARAIAAHGGGLDAAGADAVVAHLGGSAATGDAITVAAFLSFCESIRDTERSAPAAPADPGAAAGFAPFPSLPPPPPRPAHAPPLSDDSQSLGGFSAALDGRRREDDWLARPLGGLPLSAANDDGWLTEPLGPGRVAAA